MWYDKYDYEGPLLLEDFFKKRKSDSKLGLFSKFNKRWFTLDFKLATFGYSSGPNKKQT
jgi:hypothetical protein